MIKRSALHVTIDLALVVVESSTRRMVATLLGKAP